MGLTGPLRSRLPGMGMEANSAAPQYFLFVCITPGFSLPSVCFSGIQRMTKPVFAFLICHIKYSLCGRLLHQAVNSGNGN